MATRSNRDDGPHRDIRLIQNPDGRWTARDRDHELSAEGKTRDAALDALDAVVEAVHGEGGHEPTDEEIEALGVDPDTARSQSEELPDVLE